MTKVLNTLYLTQDKTEIRKEGETIAVRIAGERCLEIPMHHLEGIVCFGKCRVSPVLMGECAKRGLAISFLTPYGKFLARIEGPTRGNVLLRREQYRRADSPTRRIELAQAFVTGKIANSRHLLLRGARDASLEAGREILKEACQTLRALGKRVLRTQDLDELRGVEGSAARTYFESFPLLLKVDAGRLDFHGQRSRRPPRDPINATLSFLYGLVRHDCASALEVVGLDPGVGYLHAERPGRPTLALDMMEEFRPALADRLMFTLFNRQQLQKGDFISEDAGAVRLRDDGRKVLLTEYQHRKQTEVIHPFTGRKVPLGVAIHLQATLLARTLRGNLEIYPPYQLR